MVDDARRPLVLILCGWLRDRDLVTRFLATLGADAWPMGAPAELRELLDGDRIDLVLADSSRGSAAVADLLAILDGRAETLDLPMVLLAEPDALSELADMTTRRFNAVLLTKPVVQEQLAAAVVAGLRFRARQRQVRDLLRQLETSNAELERRRDESVEEARRKTRFLAAISHDIRTPVNALVLTCQLLQMLTRGEPDRSEVRELASVLLANAGALVELVNDLLDIARYDQGKLEFTESEFPLGAFIDAVVEGLRPLAEQKTLALRTEVATPSAVVRTDRVKLGRVLQNLVSNAVKFTESGEILVVARAGTADGLFLSVKDTGIGIPEAMREGIFDEFAQLRNPERDRTKGTGLGLAICRRLVTAMRGEIRVVGDSEASGSTFLVRLPGSCVVSDGLPAPDRDDACPKPGLAARFGGRVLVVDDHEPSRTVMRRLLQRLGLIVEVAVNGRHALEQLERSRPSVVLLDLMMPEMGGLETLQAIRARPEWSDLPVVILTGDLGERVDAVLDEAGASAFISKPLDLSRLTALLADLLPAEGEGEGEGEGRLAAR